MIDNNNHDHTTGYCNLQEDVTSCGSCGSVAKLLAQCFCFHQNSDYRNDERTSKFQDREMRVSHEIHSTSIVWDSCTDSTTHYRSSTIAFTMHDR